MELAQPQLAERPDSLAIADESGEYSWRQVNERVNRLIHGLRGLGLQVGDGVAIMANNRHEFLEVNAACFHGGFVLVPINWHLVADEVAYILNDSGAKILFSEIESLDVADKATAQIGGPATKILFSGGSADGWLDYEALLESNSPDEPADQVGGGTMYYTSGTTGQPKGVRSTALTPGQPVSGLMQIIQGVGGLIGILGENTLVNSPLYHAGPMAAASVSSALGGAIVLRRKFDPLESMQLIQDMKLGQAYFVPTHFVRFLKLDEAERKKYDLSSLKNVWHTGAPCAPDVKRAVIEWLGPVLTEYYGASEGLGSGTMIKAEDWLRKPGTVGKPLPTCEVHILSEDGQELPTGEIGQVWFKTLIGADFEYLGAPDKTKDVHKEPGFYTYGDVGYLDEDGFLFLSDRKIDMIVSGGANIYPAEIEAVLITHPKVQDVAVFGVPNEEFGEEVKAAVQLVDGVEPNEETLQELKAFARDKLAGYKNPRSWEFHVDFPRTPTGKLQKRLLRDPYWEGKTRSI